jgi:hypothetical protein
VIHGFIPSSLGVIDAQLAVSDLNDEAAPTIAGAFAALGAA